MKESLPPMTTVELDKLSAQGCQMPGCEGNCGNTDHEFFFHARCHPKAPAWVSYSAAEAVLTVVCGVCRKLIARVKVQRMIEGNGPLVLMKERRV